MDKSTGEEITITDKIQGSTKLKNQVDRSTERAQIKGGNNNNNNKKTIKMNHDSTTCRVEWILESPQSCWACKKRKGKREAPNLPALRPCGFVHFFPQVERASQVRCLRYNNQSKAFPLPFHIYTRIPVCMYLSYINTHTHTLPPSPSLSHFPTPFSDLQNRAQFQGLSLHRRLGIRTRSVNFVDLDWDLF